MEVNRDAVREHAAAVERNSEELPRLAVWAGGADQVTCPQASLDAAVNIPDSRSHAVAVLGDGNEFGTVENLGTGLLGARPQDRFEPRLGNE